MFVVPTATAAADIGLSLAEAYAGDELLSDVRVALAVGPVLVHDGDYYGPVVNLAGRVVNVARPGTVVVSDEFRTQLFHEDGRRIRHAAVAGAHAEGHRQGAAVEAGASGNRARCGPRPHRALGATGRGATRARRARRARGSLDRRRIGFAAHRLIAAGRVQSASLAVAIPCGRSSNDPSKGESACPRRSTSHPLRPGDLDGRG